MVPVYLHVYREGAVERSTVLPGGMALNCAVLSVTPCILIINAAPQAVIVRLGPVMVAVFMKASVVFAFLQEDKARTAIMNVTTIDLMSL